MRVKDHPFLSSYHHHLPRKLGTVTGVASPSLPRCLFRWHPSCRMVVGHPRLTWGTVLRDPGPRLPFSSDSSLRWEPPSGPRLQVCRRLVVLGLCFTGWRTPPLPPSSLAGRHTRPQGLSSLLPSHSLPPPPLHPSPPLLGKQSPSMIRSLWRTLPSHRVSKAMDVGHPWFLNATTLLWRPPGWLTVWLKPPRPLPSPLPLPSVVSSSLHDFPFLSAPLRWDLGEMAGLAVSP